MANYEDRITTIRDILQMSPEQRRSEYGVKGVFTDKDGNSVARHIDKVTINGNVFTDYSAFSFLWEKSYVKSPERSGAGTIGNLNSYATFLTPHLKIDFGLMSIDSYRKIMQLIYSSNEFLVTCYDVVNNKDTTNKMYFSTEEMPKLWTIVDALNGDENAIMLLGVQDYTVEMIGTNNEVDKITVNYYLNSPTGIGQTTPIYSEDVAIGGEIVLGLDTNISSYEQELSGYLFEESWSLGSPDGTKYNHKDGFPILNAFVDENSNSINFYANWRTSNTYTLTYAYGLGTPKIDQETMQTISSKRVIYNMSIGVLPSSDTLPKVEYGEGEEKKTYYPYTWLGWYKTSIKTKNSEKINDNDLFWIKADTTIYQLYKVSKHLVTYIVDGKIFSQTIVEYGTQIPMPILEKENKTFKGWRFDYNNNVVTSLTMPPFDAKLTAIFE